MPCKPHVFFIAGSALFYCYLTLFQLLLFSPLHFFPSQMQARLIKVEHSCCMTASEQLECSQKISTNETFSAKSWSIYNQDLMVTTLLQVSSGR